MQMGPFMLGILGGRSVGDEELLSFYRDLAASPGVLGLYGKAQRAYRGLSASGEQSDLLYEDLSDFFIRITEIFSNEDLGSHEAAFARYLRCLDVKADLVDSGYSRGTAMDINARLNMFRAQSHDHR